MAEVDVGRRRVEPHLDRERPSEGELRLELQDAALDASIEYKADLVLLLAYLAALCRGLVGTWRGTLTVLILAAGIVSLRDLSTILMVLAPMAATLAGAWLLSGHPTGGFVWTVAALFLLPLPLIPWLYARTFGRDRD